MVTYDIEDNRVRRRVHNMLKNHGKRVQYSVFECWLSVNNIEGLRQKVTQELDVCDAVRWYPLCSWCQKKISWQGRGNVSDDPKYHLL